MARPSQKRRHVLCIRLTDEEMRVLRLNAETAAVDLSTIARAQILGGPIPRRARRVSLNRQKLGEAMHAVGKLGTNLNQLTKGPTRPEAFLTFGIYDPPRGFLR